jgi:hypothetical protein
MCCSAADSFRFIYILNTHARAYGDQFIPLYIGLQICDLYPNSKKPTIPTKVFAGNVNFLQILFYKTKDTGLPTVPTLTMYNVLIVVVFYVVFLTTGVLISP